jgi:hypothetical protein
MISDGLDIEPPPGWIFCIKSLVETTGRHSTPVDREVVTNLERFLRFLEIQDYPMPHMIRTYNEKLVEVIWVSGKRLMSVQSAADQIWIEVGFDAGVRKPVRGRVDRGRVAFRWVQHGGSIPR